MIARVYACEERDNEITVDQYRSMYVIVWFPCIHCTKLLYCAVRCCLSRVDMSDLSQCGRKSCSNSNRTFVLWGWVVGVAGPVDYLSCDKYPSRCIDHKGKSNSLHCYKEVLKWIILHYIVVWYPASWSVNIQYVIISGKILSQQRRGLRVDREEWPSQGTCQDVQ